MYTIFQIVFIVLFFTDYSSAKLNFSFIHGLKAQKYLNELKQASMSIAFEEITKNEEIIISNYSTNCYRPQMLVTLMEILKITNNPTNSNLEATTSEENTAAKKQDHTIIFGPECLCNELSKVTNAVDIPLIQWNCDQFFNQKLFSNKNIDLSHSNQNFLNGLDSLIEQFEWKKLSIIYDDAFNVKNLNFSHQIIGSLLDKKIPINIHKHDPNLPYQIGITKQSAILFTKSESTFDEERFSDFNDLVKSIITQSRIIVLACSFTTTMKLVEAISLFQPSLNYSEFIFLSIDVDYSITSGEWMDKYGSSFSLSSKNNVFKSINEYLKQQHPNINLNNRHSDDSVKSNHQNSLIVSQYKLFLQQINVLSWQPLISEDITNFFQKLIKKIESKTFDIDLNILLNNIHQHDSIKNTINLFKKLSEKSTDGSYGSNTNDEDILSSNKISNSNLEAFSTLKHKHCIVSEGKDNHIKLKESILSLSQFIEDTEAPNKFVLQNVANLKFSCVNDTSSIEVLIIDGKKSFRSMKPVPPTCGIEGLGSCDGGLTTTIIVTIACTLCLFIIFLQITFLCIKIYKNRSALSTQIWRIDKDELFFKDTAALTTWPECSNFEHTFSNNIYTNQSNQAIINDDKIFSTSFCSKVVSNEGVDSVPIHEKDVRPSKKADQVEYKQDSSSRSMNNDNSLKSMTDDVLIDKKRISTRLNTNTARWLSVRIKKTNKNNNVSQCESLDFQTEKIINNEEIKNDDKHDNLQQRSEFTSHNEEEEDMLQKYEMQQVVQHQEQHQNLENQHERQHGSNKNNISFGKFAPIQAYYRGNLVRVKRLLCKNSHSNLPKNVINELNKLMNIQNTNINSYIGIVFDNNNSKQTFPSINLKQKYKLSSENNTSTNNSNNNENSNIGLYYNSNIDDFECDTHEESSQNCLKYDKSLSSILIISQWASNYSLRDVLANRRLKFDSLFMLSLVNDIVKGMSFLHSNGLGSHGRLTSSNCVIDGRWVLKISDYGLNELLTDFHVESHCRVCANCTTSPKYVDTTTVLRRASIKSANQVSNFLKIKRNRSFDVLELDVSDTKQNTKLVTNKITYCSRMLYWAPELLRMNKIPINGTMAGDVYSFAIILQEIYDRALPWSSVNLSLEDIITRVRNGTDECNQILRPYCKEEPNGAEELVSIMDQCWAEDPESRPSFSDLKNIIQQVMTNHGVRTNVLDNMIYMLEKYTEHLEELVKEKTGELVEEKNRTDKLLDRMLPRIVAQQLMRGRNVDAESFDMVTVYFSDIVGFTTICAVSDPMQVVNFLNDLYTGFDGIASQRDVYKVETIGDAYVVASGLPTRNGNLHAGEIAQMALGILNFVKTFKIRHFSDMMLKVRIGLHSGPVVAGVVGSTMPRYCLFGDTVTVANHLETTGEAGQIHASHATIKLLDELTGYVHTYRHQQNITGKGSINTYWLEEYRGCSEYPTPSACPLSN